MKYWLLLSGLLLISGVFAQVDDDERKRIAKELILNAKYEDALATLRVSQELRYRDRESRFLMGLCQYQLNHLDEAEALLQALTKGDKNPFPEIWLYLGKIYHARHQFAEAASLYKSYLHRIGSNHPSRRMVQDELRRCANGIQFQYREARAFVENLGPGVNTEYDEFGPVLSPNHQQRLYFSTRRPGNIGGPRNRYGESDDRLGKYYSDIYLASNPRGNWGEVQPMHHLVNSPRHEVLLGFNKDGSAMYFYQGNDWFNGSVTIDSFQQGGSRRLSSDPFLGPLDPIVDQAAPHFYSTDVVLFASRRSGGYGGYDLYLTVRSKGVWSEPVNLGPDINTPYDETTPFLSRDGKTLYYSSNDSRRSIGGYDVFKSTYLAEAGRWLPPQHLGLPVNSAGDDTHFRLASDGFTSFFCSSRKDGFGRRDLYIAYFNDFLTEQEPVNNLSETYFHQFRQRVTTASAAARPSATASAADAPRQGDLVIRPITFRNREELFNKDNRQVLDQLAGMLSEHADWELAIKVHAETGASVSESLYEAIEKATPAAEYLVRQGASADQLTLRGKMNHFQTRNVNPEYAVDFSLSGKGAGQASGQWQQLEGQTPDPPLVYRLQIATLNSSFTGNYMNDFPVPVVEKKYGQPRIHYLSGAFDTYIAAKKWQSDLKQRLALRAEIIPYIHGDRASLNTAEEWRNQLPDLKAFLDDQAKAGKFPGN